MICNDDMYINVSFYCSPSNANTKISIIRTKYTNEHSFAVNKVHSLISYEVASSLPNVLPHPVERGHSLGAFKT
jgi:hypothetical protein